MVRFKSGFEVWDLKWMYTLANFIVDTTLHVNTVGEGVDFGEMERKGALMSGSCS